MKVILPDCVKPYVVEVFTEAAQFSQSQKLSLIQITNLVLLSQVHRVVFTVYLNSRAKTHCFADSFVKPSF
jgi:hypothetical protein